MRNILFLLLLLILAGCSMFQKKPKGLNQQYVIKPLTLVQGKDTSYVNELQIYNVNSPLDGSAFMYEKFGDYNERMISKYQEYTDRVRWNDIVLFEDLNQKFTVITDGIHRRHPNATCFIVFDEKGEDCFADGHSLKNRLMLFFGEEIKNPSNESVKKFVVNSNANGDYRSSIHEIRGKLNESEKVLMLKNISKALDTSLTPDKTQLIHYKQSAPNCFLSDSLTSDDRIAFKHDMRVLNKISRKYNVQSFYVFEQNAPITGFLLEQNEFLLDSGYFYNDIFTEHENCGAFLMIMPDGRFIKYYGEDYYSLIIDFLEK